MLIFPIISLTIIAGLTRYITKSWISPGSFFSFCWCFFLIVPIIFASDYKTDHLALWFITIFSMSLSVGSVIAYSICSIQSEQNAEPFHFDYNFLYFLLLLFCSISLLGIFLLFRFAANSYSSGNYINNIFMIPNLIAVDRYAGLLDYPSLIKYSLYFIYPANLLGGLLFGLEKKSLKKTIFSLIPLFAAILLGIIEGARTSILLGLVLFFSSWLSAFMFKPKQKITIKTLFLRFAFGGTAFITLFTIFFILIQWLRQGMDTIIIDLLIDRIRAYFFGYLAAFSQWLGGNSEINFNNGFITFAGPFNLMGIIERPLGFYEPTNIARGISTNIFTAFRGIVADFSIPGSIFIAFIIGFITQIIFQSNSKLTLLSMVPISMFYSFTLYSPLISIFHYNSILFSWLILTIILILSKYESVDSYS